MLDSPKNTSVSQIVSVQYLRGIAASAVAVYHIGTAFGLQWEIGASGVDIFFVISGFIMWLVTRQREAHPKQFIKKRIVRIVPLYWITTAALAICAFLKPNLLPLDHPTLSHVAQSLVFIPHISPSGILVPLIVQGWTLNYEMFFYALFAIGLTMPERRQFAGLSFALIGLAVVGYLAEFSDPMGRTYTSPLLLEFLAGICIAKLWLSDRSLTRGIAVASIVVGIVGIVIGAMCSASLPRLLYAGLPAAAIVLGMVSLERSGWMPHLPFLKSLGDASYSIYLTHYLTWSFISVVVTKFWGTVSLPLYPPTVLLALFVGTLSYRFLEKPLIKISANRLCREPDQLPVPNASLQN